jgi:2-amino-4-hydroxy-6-hydroxymethyldihydropteridine diphosphokinase
MARVFIGIGSNIDPEKNIRQALRRLAQAVRLTAISTFYREPALERPREPAFYNGVVAVETDSPPARLKQDLLRKIETDLGRHRSSDKFASRPIDLDLLLYDDCVISDDELTLPDPDILERAFVAIPLCELAPDLMLPGFGLPVCRVADRFAGEDLERLAEYTRLLRDEFLHSAQ